MDAATEQAVVIWPLLLFTAGALGLIVVMLGLSAVLGGRHGRRREAGRALLLDDEIGK